MARPATVGTSDSAGPESGWQEFFCHPYYLRFSSAILTPERTILEVDAITRWLGLTPGSSIIDLGCGHGR
ncbi:MAG TPA: hypothetical protein VF834_22845 [Streptosporangiaceae bacterium]